MKRFTDSEKWDDPWFFDLPTRAKLLWFYICDKCDCAGVFQFCPSLVSVLIGEQVTEKDLELFGDRIEKLPSGRFLIRKFIKFQCGNLSPDCFPHKKILQTVANHSIAVQNGIYTHISKTTHTPTLPPTLPTRVQDKEKEVPGNGSAEGKGALDYSDGYPLPAGKPVNGNGVHPITSIQAFSKFWAAYPKKVAEIDAQRAWTEVHATDFTDKILKAVRDQANGSDWKRDGGRYIPLAANWLRAQRWNDAPPKPPVCF